MNLWRALYICLLLLLVIPVGVYVQRIYTEFYSHIDSVNNKKADLWYAWPAGMGPLITDLDEMMKDGECVLLFSMAEYAYYGERCYRSHLDEKLVGLYKSGTLTAAKKILGDLNLTYIVTPPYGMAEVYNSVVGEILNDADSADLLEDLGGYRLYRLKPPNSLGATGGISERLYGKKELRTELHTKDFISSIKRLSFTMQSDEFYYWALEPVISKNDTLEAGTHFFPGVEYQVKIETSLTGYAEVFAVMLGPDNTERKRWLWNGLVGHDGAIRLRFKQQNSEKDVKAIGLRLPTGNRDAIRQMLVKKRLGRRMVEKS